MQLFFHGVGEACDPEHGNTAFLVNAANGVNVLCDCGFSIPHSFFATCDDAEMLDLIWISHFHGDHFFGIPLLLLRLWEMKRAGALTICGQPGIDEKVSQALELSFPGFGAKLSYDIRYEVIEPGQPREIAGLCFQAAETIHSQRNLGLLLDDGSRKLYYSGDGRPSEAVKEFVEQCDIAVHEAFMLEDDFPSHGSIKGCLELFNRCNDCTVALVHLERTFRRDHGPVIDQYLQENPNLIMPVQGTRIDV